jgi:hypothetical protein
LSVQRPQRQAGAEQRGATERQNQQSTGGLQTDAERQGLLPGGAEQSQHEDAEKLVRPDIGGRERQNERQAQHHEQKRCDERRGGNAEGHQRECDAGDFQNPHREGVQEHTGDGAALTEKLESGGKLPSVVGTGLPNRPRQKPRNPLHERTEDGCPALDQQQRGQSGEYRRQEDDWKGGLHQGVGCGQEAHTDEQQTQPE